MEYLEGNIPLAKQVLSVLDMVHYRVSKILHIDDITKLDNIECYMNDDDDDDDDDDVNNDNNDDDANDLAQYLLSTCTKTQFTDARSLLEDVGVTSVPSHYKMTNNQPNMVTTFYGDKNKDKDLDTTPVDLIEKLERCVATNCEELNIKKSVDNKDLDIKALTKRLHRGEYKAGIIDGEYSGYVTCMINDHIKAGRLLSGNVIILDGYDGAVHVSSTNNEIGIVSYSSLLFHESFFVHSITTATSGNILTWMQSITDETRETLLPLLIPIYESQKKLRERASTTHEGATFYYYQCHDAKCIYVLTGHAHFTRLKKPYLLCKCDRGDGARDPNHVCTFISDNEQVELYDKGKSNGIDMNMTQIIWRMNIKNGLQIRTTVCQIGEYIRRYLYGVVFDLMYFIWDVQLENY